MPQYQITSLAGISVMEICAINVKWLGEDHAVRFSAWMKLRMTRTEQVEALCYKHGYSKVRQRFYRSVRYLKLSDGPCSLMSPF